MNLQGNQYFLTNNQGRNIANIGHMNLQRKRCLLLNSRNIILAMAQIVRSVLPPHYLARFNDLEKYETRVLIRIVYGDVSLLAENMREDITNAMILAKDIVDRRIADRNPGTSTYGFIRQKVIIELQEMLAAGVFANEECAIAWISQKTIEHHLDDDIIASLYKIISEV